MPASAGRTIRAPRARPAATSSVESARMARRAIMAWAWARGCGLRRVPGERHRRGVALVVVVGRAVEAHAEAVAVRVAAREGAERGGRVHARDGAAVRLDVVGVAAGGRG